MLLEGTLISELNMKFIKLEMMREWSIRSNPAGTLQRARMR